MSCGQSYKASTSVNYDSRVVNVSNLLVLTILGGLVIYGRKMCIRLTTGHSTGQFSSHLERFKRLGDGHTQLSGAAWVYHPEVPGSNNKCNIYVFSIFTVEIDIIRVFVIGLYQEQNQGRGQTACIKNIIRIQNVEIAQIRTNAVYICYAKHV